MAVTKIQAALPASPSLQQRDRSNSAGLDSIFAQANFDSTSFSLNIVDDNGDHAAGGSEVAMPPGTPTLTLPDVALPTFDTLTLDMGRDDMTGPSTNSPSILKGIAHPPF